MESNYSLEDFQTAKQLAFPEANDAEFKLFCYKCKIHNVHPLSGNIYPNKRWNRDKNRNDLSFDFTIEHLRLEAERSGKYEGQKGPFWSDDKGTWTDVWISKKAPAAAKLGIMKTGFKEPLWGTVSFDEGVQTKKDGNPYGRWVSAPASMLAIAAERLALRRAFPSLSNEIENSEPKAIGTTQKTLSGGNVEFSQPIINDIVSRETPKQIVGDIIPNPFEVSTRENEFLQIASENKWTDAQVEDALRETFNHNDIDKLTPALYKWFCSQIVSSSHASYVETLRSKKDSKAAAQIQAFKSKGVAEVEAIAQA